MQSCLLHEETMGWRHLQLNPKKHYDNCRSSPIHGICRTDPSLGLVHVASVFTSMLNFIFIYFLEGQNITNKHTEEKNLVIKNFALINNSSLRGQNLLTIQSIQKLILEIKQRI
ncbi:hypothetical protein V6Z11_D05G229900 [Gossypium hirsutum]